MSRDDESQQTKEELYQCQRSILKAVVDASSCAARPSQRLGLRFERQWIIVNESWPFKTDISREFIATNEVSLVLFIDVH